MSKEKLYFKLKMYWQEKSEFLERRVKQLERENRLLKDKVDFLQRKRRNTNSFGKGKWNEMLKKARREGRANKTE